MYTSVIRAVLECLCGKSFRKNVSKKLDKTSSNDRMDALEEGKCNDEEEWDGEFESWDKPTQPAAVTKPLQSLDDFDGMAPPKTNNQIEDKTDLFATIGMVPTYIAPKQIDISNKPTTKSKAPVVGLDDDVDIDIDNWETGNVRKQPKKKLAGTKI
jgi:hypothetical protein